MSKDLQPNVSPTIKLKVGDVEVTATPPPVPRSAWRAAWGLLGSGLAGAGAVLLIGTGVGVVIAGIGVAAVAAREVVDGLTLDSDDAPDANTTALHVQEKPEAPKIGS